MVAAPGDDQQRPPGGVAGVGLHLGPRVEVREPRLEQGPARPGDVQGLVELSSLLVRQGVGPAVAELGEGEADRAGAVEGGLASTGMAARRAEIGSGSTPRKGAGSIATVAALSPRPAAICDSSPPKE